LFAGAPDGAFSFTDLFHKAESAGRLYALVHDGAWYHVGTPEALQDTEKKLRQK
jgi:MurNAc alpha-1-phosphate uridylyltransferase